MALDVEAWSTKMDNELRYKGFNVFPSPEIIDCPELVIRTRRFGYIFKVLTELLSILEKHPDVAKKVNIRHEVEEARTYMNRYSKTLGLIKTSWVQTKDLKNPETATLIELSDRIFETALKRANVALSASKEYMNTAA